MTCDEVNALQAALLDGQVDGLRAFALRRHIAGCPACAARQAQVLNLQARLRAELPRYAAPPGLHQRLHQRLNERLNEDLTQASGATPPSWIAGGLRGLGLRGRLGTGLAGLAGLVAGAALASLGWTVLPALPGWNSAPTLSTRLVALHTRATLADRLIDVASSDRHTVKPWLSARLDYSPPVFDAAEAGFALQGARIARLDGHDVAVLVYRRRQHLIDVVVRPGVAAGTTLAAVVRGFNLSTASGAEMQWLAVSDLNAAELADFLRRLAAGQWQG